MLFLETERLTLRNYKTTDFEDVFEYFSNDEVAKYEDFHPMTSTEAGKALIKHLFDDIKIEVLYGDCDIRNENSWKLMERLGFVRIKETEGDSYKYNAEGNPILITSCTYQIKRENIRYL